MAGMEASPGSRTEISRGLAITGSSRVSEMVSMVGSEVQPVRKIANNPQINHFFIKIPPERNIRMLLKLLLIYLILINAAGFLLMLADKYKAKKHLWRIPEATLMLSAAMGGSVGALLGMYTFRHKTRHPKFTVGIPVILVLQIAAAVGLYMAFHG